MKDLISLNLENAEHSYLIGRGWKFFRLTKHYTPPEPRGYVFPGDKVFRHTAIQVQKSLDRMVGI